MCHTPQDETTRKIAADALLHEYDFVESLIPLYRQFQMQLLRYGLLVYTALLGLWATQVSADAESNVFYAALALMPYPISFMLLAFTTTEVRIKRASRHIVEAIVPKLKCLSGEMDVLTWEREPGRTLNWVEKALSTSLSFILVLGAPAIGGSMWYLKFSDPTIWLVGQMWAVIGFWCLVISAGMALLASYFHEFRQATNGSSKSTA